MLVNICANACVNVCEHVWMFVYICVDVCVNVYICMTVCVNVCVHVWILADVWMFVAMCEYYKYSMLKKTVTCWLINWLCERDLFTTVTHTDSASESSSWLESLTSTSMPARARSPGSVGSRSRTNTWRCGLARLDGVNWKRSVMSP